MALLFKPGVETSGLAPAGVRILARLDAVSEVIGRHLTVTSVSDGVRRPTDPHKRGEAVDVRTSDLSEGQILAAHTWLTKSLGPDFTVLYEVRSKPNGVLGSIAYVSTSATASHFHLQLRRGLGVWPRTS